MATFAVLWDYTGDAAVTEASRAAHGAYVRQLLDHGKLLEAGPWTDGSGALLIFSVEDRAELDGLIADDPYTTGGVIVRNDVHEWKASLGLVTR
jgi:uncharacterized protein YciI